MVNLGLNLSGFVSVLQIVAALSYYVFAIVRTRHIENSFDRRLPSIFISIILIISGSILFFNGWHLDPILQFQEFLTTIFVIYLLFLDFFDLSRLP
jgi:multisubunit Na+/H+ antiporter MnhB subunit